MNKYKLDVTLWNSESEPFGREIEFLCDGDSYGMAHSIAWRLADENNAQVIDFWVTDEDGNVF